MGNRKKSVRKGPAASAKAREQSNARPIRAGAHPARMFNSGLEVWLYDGADAPHLRASGAIADLINGAQSKLHALIGEGRLVGYSLDQDDELDVEVIVGEPLSTSELARAAWLEPQTAWLCVASGRLRVDSNDTMRIGPEEPGDEGAEFEIPRGDYRVTLYRIDDEALDRAERSWQGAREIIVLTAGGTAADAAKGMLPFEPRRDLSWVGQYHIEGRTLTGLAWFADAWDTCRINLDRAGATRLGLETGSVIRTTVPSAGLSLVTAIADSWVEGGKLEPPQGMSLDEYGYGYIAPMAEWNGQEVLLCRRAFAKYGVKSPQMHTWIPAVVELLDVRATPPARVRGEILLDAGRRAYWRGDLRARAMYWKDPGLLAGVLMTRLEGLSRDERLPLEGAVERVDAVFHALGLEPLGDATYDAAFSMGGTRENTVRLYAGLADVCAFVVAAENTFMVWFASQFDGGPWALTGTASPGAAQAASKRHGLSVRAPQGRLAAVFEAHRAHTTEIGRPALPAPQRFEEALKRYEDYLRVALD